MFGRRSSWSVVRGRRGRSWQFVFYLSPIHTQISSWLRGVGRLIYLKLHRSRVSTYIDPPLPLGGVGRHRSTYFLKQGSTYLHNAYQLRMGFSLKVDTRWVLAYLPTSTQKQVGNYIRVGLSTILSTQIEVLPILANLIPRSENSKFEVPTKLLLGFNNQYVQ